MDMSESPLVYLPVTNLSYQSLATTRTESRCGVYDRLDAVWAVIYQFRTADHAEAMFLCKRAEVSTAGTKSIALTHDYRVGGLKFGVCHEWDGWSA
jgi:hypothetical protein